jgi:hypothetical protein
LSSSPSYFARLLVGPRAPVAAAEYSRGFGP